MKNSIVILILLKSLVVVAQLTTTWNGSSWSDSAPTASVEAIIAGNYTAPANGTITAKKLTINSGVLTVNSGNLTVQNELINNATASSVVLENNANLIQGTATTVNTNVGAITIKRNSSLLKQLDYTLWSSPVANQNLLSFSPATVLNRFYNYNTTTNLYNAVPNVTTTAFATGNGYLIRMPDTANPTIPTAYAGVFTGTPHNGTISYTMTVGAFGFNFNLVGNPYPSPISMTQFVLDNSANITGTLYFWRKTNGVSGGAYCTWNNGIFVTNNNLQSQNPNGIIQTGQGFIVESKNAATSLTFTNAQRIGNITGQFFKTSQVVVDDNRIFLNATSPAGDFSQMAVTYVTGATNGVDAFDAKYFNDGAIALNSFLDAADYVIQGRALPFDPADEVPLSFSAAAAGTYTIAIDRVEGLFAGSQDVLLKDNVTGIETDLKAGNYTFSAPSGKTTSRFVLKYLKNTTIWNGLSWSNGAPTITTEAIIAGDYTTTSNGTLTAKKLFVNSGILTVDSGNLNVQNELINNAGAAAVVLENNANLIQGAATIANTNVGFITVKRNSSLLKRLDYTIWSSPATNANQFLKTFSPLTLDERFYNYNEATNLYNAVTTPNLPSATEFEKGAGYLIRMPNTADAITPTSYSGVFTGLPNNGTITKTVTYLDATHCYNMVGNPYPSTLSAQAFIDANTANIESSLYFWRKINNPLDLSTAYAVYNSLGSTATASSLVPNGTIQVGQGFFVKAKSGATTISFTNAMRLANTTAPFFKTKQVAEKSRIWLNLTNTTGFFSQALIGYTTEASQGVDDFDAKYFNDSPIALTSNINNEEYTIQGRSSFDVSDVVDLNFKTDMAGDFTIGLDHFDGLFATGQTVYLVDRKTGTETDLKMGSYTFATTVETDNTRFSLQYQKTLKIEAKEFNENSVVVYRKKGVLYVNSSTVAINNIKVFDIQGRQIAEQKNLKTNTATFKDLKSTHQVLIVTISSEDNKLVTKKIIN